MTMYDVYIPQLAKFRCGGGWPVVIANPFLWVLLLALAPMPPFSLTYQVVNLMVWVALTLYMFRKF